MQLLPRDRQGWVRLASRWFLVALLLMGAMAYVTQMPGRSFSGPLPPLSAEEVEVRDRLRAHVARLAGEIGERNLWRYPALEAAAA